MNRRAFVKIMDMLEAAYPARFEKMDGERKLEFFNTWYRGLCDLDTENLERAVMKHIRDSRFFPTIAELRENAQKPVPTAGIRELFERFANYYPSDNPDCRSAAFKIFFDKVKGMDPEARWNETIRIKTAVLRYVQACELDGEEPSMPLCDFLEAIGV